MQSMIFRQIMAEGRYAGYGTPPHLMAQEFDGLRESPTEDNHQLLTRSFDSLALQDNAKQQRQSRTPAQSMAPRGNPHAKYGHHSFDGSETRIPNHAFPEQAQVHQHPHRHTPQYPPISEIRNATSLPSPPPPPVQPHQFANSNNYTRSKRSSQLPPTHKPRHRRTGSVPASAPPYNVPVFNTQNTSQHTTLDEAMAMGYMAGTHELGEACISLGNVEAQVMHDAATTGNKRTTSKRTSSKSRLRSPFSLRRSSSSKGMSSTAASSPPFEMGVSHVTFEQSKYGAQAIVSHVTPGNVAIPGVDSSAVIEFHVLPGDLGVSLKNSAFGPVIATIHPHSICPQMRVGDVIVSLDGVAVSHFPAAAVANLISSRSGNVMRRIQCVPGRILNQANIPKVR